VETRDEGRKLDPGDNIENQMLHVIAVTSEKWIIF